jgi:hypothetical protein
MVVGGTSSCAVHVGALNVPRWGLVDDSIVIPFISSAGSWSATKGITHILLFDAIQHIVFLLGPRRGHSGRGSPLTTLARCTSLIGSGHSSMKRGEVAHHLLILLLLISMDGLSMLAQVIQTRELLATVAREGTFTSVFPCCNEISARHKRKRLDD